VPIAASVRPDLPAIFLILAALAAYEAAHRRAWLLYLAGALAAASFLTKQQTVPIFVALLIDVVWARKFRECALLIAGALTVAILIVVPLWIAHEPFLANFTVIAFAVYDWPSAPVAVINFLRVDQMALIPIFIALLGAARAWKDPRYRSTLLVILFAWVSNVAALANVGGGANYLVLPWLATMLLVPAGFRQLEEWAKRASWSPLCLFALAVVILIHQRSLLHVPLPLSLNTSRVANLTMLGDNPYLEIRTKQPQLLDSFTYNEMARRGKWSDEPIRQRIDAEDYDFLWLGGNDGADNSQFLVAAFRGASFWGADVLNEMALHYRPLCETKDHLALVPMDRKVPLEIRDVEEIFHQTCHATRRSPQIMPGNS
jgi:hypothetical protein